MTDSAPSSASSAAPTSDGASSEPSSLSQTASVEDLLTSVDAAVRSQQEAYVEAIRGDVVTPLKTALHELRSAHRTARAELDAETDRPAAWAQVAAYRQRVVEAVWMPLRDTLASLRIGRQLHERRDGLRSARESLPDDLPETIRRPEPEALSARAATDSVRHQIGKASVRFARWLRRLVGSPEPPEQTIPLADLVRYHAGVRLAEGQAEPLDVVEQHLGGWVAMLESVAASWTHTLLEAERLLDDASFHRRDGIDHRSDGSEEDLLDGNALDAEGEASSPVDVDRLLASIHAEADALDDMLAHGLDLHLDETADALDALANEAHEALQTDVARAGSFWAKRRPASVPRRLQRRQKQREDRAAAWPDWHTQAVARLNLLTALCALREAVEGTHEALVEDTLAAGIESVQDVYDDAIEQLEALFEEVDALLQSPESGEERALLVALDSRVEKAGKTVEDVLLNPLRQLSVRRNTADAVEKHIQALNARADEQPQTFAVHPRPGRTVDRVEPEEAAQEVEWREIVHTSLDALLFDAWREALPPIATVTDTATRRAEEVQQIVQFNLGAAVEEIQDLIAARRRGEDGEEVANARELALDGLQRSMDALRNGQKELAAARVPFADATWTATTQAWARLHDRARAAGRAREHVLRLQSVLTYRLRDLGSDVQKRTREATIRMKRALQIGRRRTERLVRMGQSAVGVGAVDEAELQETVEALSSVDAVLETLPVVYRRLFSFRPVSDPHFLVARDDDLRLVQRLVDQWNRGLTNALVLTGAPGSGLTSTLNVFRKTALREGRRHSIELSERTDSEAAFAGKVVRALGLQMPAPEPLTLDAVAEKLLDAPRPERLRVCTIEHLEHAFDRTVGGTKLMARILSFLSETDSRVLWIGTMSSSAWQIIGSYEPAATALVVHREMGSVDRKGLEELIMRRHRHSGLRLTFDVPDESTNPLLVRRIRAASDEERRQEILRTEFFDRLYTVCGQNIMLALFYWFRSVHLDPDDEQAVLHVRPLQPIRFDFLDAFSLAQAFALKALLDHASLTVDEMADVLQVDVASSYALLESLGNALLLTSSESLDPPGGFQFASVERGVRYRIRPLVIHPVTRFLRSRNIIH